MSAAFGSGKVILTVRSFYERLKPLTDRTACDSAFQFDALLALRLQTRAAHIHPTSLLHDAAKHAALPVWSNGIFRPQTSQ